MSTCHSFVSGVRLPVKITLLSCEIMTAEAVNATLHPASHNCPMDNSGWVASWGTTWPCRAAGGSAGQFRSASCVEWMILPDGVWMASGSAVGRLLQTGVVLEKKWAVHPESAIAKNGCWVAGGPATGGDETTKEGDGGGLTGSASLVVVVTVAGFPRPQALGAGRSARRRYPRAWMVFLPPCMFVAVALLMCPSPGLAHVALV